MTCKDCIHYDVCVIVENSANKDKEDYYTEFGCDDFKNKADYVEVVRCKDCIYHNVAPCPMRLSLNWTDDYDFCNFGNRGEN